MGSRQGGAWSCPGTEEWERSSWGGHFRHREVSQGFLKQRLGLLFWGEMGNRKKQSGLSGLPGGRVDMLWAREGVDPKLGPPCEPTLGFVGALWSRKQTEGVCCHFPGTCALEGRPCPSKAPWASESCQERVLGLHTVGSFPTTVCKKQCGAATEIRCLMSEQPGLFKTWGLIGSIYRERVEQAS